MTSLRQIEANRRNARLSTGPVTEEGKQRSRRNAVRHGLTAETVIDRLEDAADYAAFELAVTSDYDAPSAVERELVLRLASLLWRLRRATAIETGLFKEQARHLLLFRQDKRGAQKNESVITQRCRSEVAGLHGDVELGPELFATCEGGNQIDGPTQAFVCLSKLPTYPLDRLSRYEAALWRQARQIVVTLRRLDRRKHWQDSRWR